MSNDWLETMNILIMIGEIRNVMEEIAEKWNNENNNKETFEQLFRENKKLYFNSNPEGGLDGYSLRIRSTPEIKIKKESKDAETFIVYDGTYCEFHEKLNSAASEWLWGKVLKLWAKDKRRVGK